MKRKPLVLKPQRDPERIQREFKQDNLTDFLTDVADAIREKKGTTEKMNPQNFSEEIKGLREGTWNLTIRQYGRLQQPETEGARSAQRD